MSIIQKLRKRIDKLSSAIEAQELLLQKLIDRRTEVQRELNYYLDPMARLPFELQSHIFMLCTPSSTLIELRSKIYPLCTHDSSTLKPDLTAPQMVFLAVSRLWRNIALATPRLWCDIQIDASLHRPNYRDLSELWLARAQDLPLSMTIGGPLALTQSVQDSVAQHSHRLENLTISLLRHMQTPDIKFNWDESTPFSCMKCLTVEADRLTYCGAMRQWLDVLRAAPALSSLRLDNIYFRTDTGIGADHHLTLASLRYLQLGKPFTWDLRQEHSSTLLILRFLTLPALEVLSISCFDLPYEELLDFLTRSSPPLQCLNIAIPLDWSFSFVARFLRLIPTLISLTLSATPTEDRSERFLPFIEVLSTSPDLLPNLREIALRTEMPLIIDYGSVVEMLTFRVTSCPTPLESFRLTSPLTVPLQGKFLLPIMPDDDVDFELHQLAIKGLKIHIGPWARNLF
ncbi:hypothetical protein R3P38DRAFT_2872454 [Favolaschia claudopus]|uniref:F-box domain-containing protein n=1 Tax=Favolaschia claudopus TaxID=2862362 RepID=A0AAW0DA62_9AGAR